MAAGGRRQSVRVKPLGTEHLAVAVVRFEFRYVYRPRAGSCQLR
jgi:hypothetical protein